MSVFKQKCPECDGEYDPAEAIICYACGQKRQKLTELLYLLEERWFALSLLEDNRDQNLVSKSVLKDAEHGSAKKESSSNSFGKKLAIGTTIFFIFVLFLMFLPTSKDKAEDLARDYAEKSGMISVEVKSTRKQPDGTYKVTGQGIGIKPNYSFYDQLYGEIIYDEHFIYYIDIKSSKVTEDGLNDNVRRLEKSKSANDKIKKQRWEVEKIIKGPVKKFIVNYKKTEKEVLIKVETDLPDGAPLRFSIEETGLGPDSIWIGNNANAIVKHGKAEVRIPLTTYDGLKLYKGKYDIRVEFNSASTINAGPNVKKKIGAFGKNLKTPHIITWDNEGKTYRLIEYKKRAAFFVN